MADHRDYAARAVRAEELAEQTVSASLANSWRRLAKSYWALARQQTEIKYRRELRQMPEIKDRDA